MAGGIVGQSIYDTPVAIIDFETTGLTPGVDRVVEVAVVRIDAAGDVRLVLDTLVNPMRRVSATEIHGITDADVANAPRFADIAGELVSSLNGCIVAAYNVYFDIKFLNAELFSVGIDHEPPHFCLMYLRPMLGLGARCKLSVACQSHGVAYTPTHIAAQDALAAGQLLGVYRREASRLGNVPSPNSAN
ncbi:MAG TPA: 3'-5' exonuclease [Nitrospiraceae bacterium]|nr:3'-5' exonuclease [Nitrospiraceae bacterium]